MPSTELTERTGLEHALRVLRRRWKLIVLCAVLVAGAAVGFSVIQQKKYTTSASLLFTSQQFDQELFGTSAAPTLQNPTAVQATNVDLVSLPVVATRTANALHLSKGLVHSEVSVSQTGQSNIVQVSVTDPHPARAALIANTYVNQFVIFRRQADRAQLASARHLVKQQLAKLNRRQRAGSVGQALLNRANQLGVLAALQTGNAEVAQTAGVPGGPSSPKTKRNGALGLLIGLLLGLVLAFVLERLDHRLREPSELERLYGVPVLSVVPQSRALAMEPYDSLPASDLESFALLRARLRYFNVDRRVDSLLVTSALSGEGKTTVALNLAIIESLTGNRNVLLFELDLRRPSLGKRLGISASPGTAEVLSGNASLEDALTRVETPHGANGRGPTTGFTLLPSGAIPPNPVELLSSRALTELLETLTQRFDIVVVDSPPVTLVSDAIPLVQHVSGVLVVARMEHTTISAARHAAEQLTNLKAPTLGVVANAVPPKDRAYYFGYGYGYYTDGRNLKDAPDVRLQEPESGREPLTSNGEPPEAGRERTEEELEWGKSVVRTESD